MEMSRIIKKYRRLSRPGRPGRQHGRQQHVMPEFRECNSGLYPDTSALKD